MKMFQFRYFPFSNGTGHRIIRNSWNFMRNYGLLLIEVKVGKHVHGMFPVRKTLITVSLTLALSDNTSVSKR